MAFVKIAPIPERKARIRLLKSGANPKKCPNCGATYTGTECQACGYNESTKKAPSESAKAMQSRKSQEQDLGKGYGGKD